MNKLKQERGATILMAILLVLIASIIAAVILSAALSAYHTLRRDRENQQNYLAVSSAAELLRDAILGDEYTRTVITQTVTDPETQLSTTLLYSDTTAPPEGLFAPWLTRGIENDGTRGTVTITVPPVGAEETALPAVQARFTMEGTDGDCGLRIFLSLAEGGEDDCRMTLIIRGDWQRVGPIDSTGGPNVVYHTTVTTVQWTGARVAKGFEEADS